MIKKFKEFVNEGLWSKTLNRGRTGAIRKEDEAFFKQDDIMQMIEPFYSYYILDNMDENATYIYKYPNTKWLAKFFDIVLSKTYVTYDSLEFSEDLSKDERKTILSPKFRQAIYDTYDKNYQTL